MAYQALYRKFRPSDFNEVYGQEHIVQTLKNQLSSGRIGHAYIFSGTRGTGKTSIAKIFAKAVNCENLNDANPCNECNSCKAINNASSLSVIELDAASNRGIDDIRRIIEDVSYPPADTKYKVYIVDEVHMLTKEAFNALLKTIEEPPEYAVFILATTEVAKIPATIISRCQRYDFHRISIDMISKRMEELKEAENVSIEDRAIRYIARQADGSMRDALSIFDQCISYYYGQNITYDMTLDMLGTVHTQMYSELFRHLCSHNAKESVHIVEEAIIRGMEPETFVSDFIWYLRNLLLVKNGEKLEDVTDISTEDATIFNEDLDITDDNFLIRSISVLSELINSLRFSQTKRITLETTLIRLCRPRMDRDIEALEDRIRILEQGKGDNISFSNVHQKKSEDDIAENIVTEKPEKVMPEETVNENMEKEDTESSVSNVVPTANAGATWGRFLETLTGPASSVTKKAVVLEDENSLTIFFDKSSRAGGYYSKTERVEELKSHILSYYGRELNIEIKFVDEKDLPKSAASVGDDNDQSDSDLFLSAVASAGIIVETED